MATYVVDPKDTTDPVNDALVIASGGEFSTQSMKANAIAKTKCSNSDNASIQK